MDCQLESQRESRVLFLADYLAASHQGVQVKYLPVYPLAHLPAIRHAFLQENQVDCQQESQRERQLRVFQREGPLVFPALRPVVYPR